MFEPLIDRTAGWLEHFGRSLFQRHAILSEGAEPFPAPPRRYERLQRVIVSDEVCRTLFEEYAIHRHSQRGDEETGWVLLGLRETAEAVVLATLPAGTNRSAGIAHVRFNSIAQAVGSR